ncbi:bifunctional phosphoribosyl-AMP cyclohydrolase/phosphoribosyl-ATP diphosphatase HisIE [Lysinibacillus fusiformis]|uniref:bifunctional phosphoribosyl-AMP cyclohydrolase/phosphoribosyl-ATP diphosphatase HisIE n=1 Tax=Lysinibacillus fusiformis TaxID=28031 RepID=UPI0011BB1592|nr:bifunctional phosphoribosyl-AMP cyclohydrolase/phosphoribosyl-ATP diphosphatase HisIE [Lysinibacillus fusiformis]MCT6817046.1 bifunctional phosphoribosyl-AMP cyclohydrolase/phosphoribosyl-ATP diphosphatase HisIE [Lysinibacillus fusiformis]MCT6929679.1 bifunctional phosphoribosyl-AMP cyclohydrolase/phosphoribosyl-ATP diphosphatase HisIE [Lysinibacillus fusiformis]MCT6934074.1 bifunctional phosphoribosyl-AMP cyclohydrolase/phosphoribosyl-ATP diphosphatase HisIE [Lysinibacillus fusiformis]QDZ97
MIERIRFDEKGLVPAVVQDAHTKEVLTVAYMNKESLVKTIESGETWFYSRSRQELWHKGATSGHTQKVVAIKTDCDQDALVVEVLPDGPACHNGTTTCFTEVVQQNAEVGSVEMIAKLVSVIEKREQEMPVGAYTTYLFDKGIDKICKKVGEEATEVVIGAKNRDVEEVKWEAADLIYHLLVLLQEQKVSIYDVLHVLKKRHEEK